MGFFILLKNIKSETRALKFDFKMIHEKIPFAVEVGTEDIRGAFTRVSVSRKVV